MKTKTYFVGVDSGMLMLVDPCYVLPRKEDGFAGVDYAEVCKAKKAKFHGGLLIPGLPGDEVYRVEIKDGWLDIDLQSKLTGLAPKRS